MDACPAPRPGRAGRGTVVGLDESRREQHVVLQVDVHVRAGLHGSRAVIEHPVTGTATRWRTVAVGELPQPGSLGAEGRVLVHQRGDLPGQGLVPGRTWFELSDGGKHPAVEISARGRDIVGDELSPVRGRAADDRVDEDGQGGIILGRVARRNFPSGPPRIPA